MNEIIYDNGPGGECPVQAEGTINGLPFYFRARGEHMALSIAKTPAGDPMVGAECFYFCEEYGDERFAAGWATADECREFIERAAKELLG